MGHATRIVSDWTIKDKEEAVVVVNYFLNLKDGKTIREVYNGYKKLIKTYSNVRKMLNKQGEDTSTLDRSLNMWLSEFNQFEKALLFLSDDSKVIH